MSEKLSEKQEIFVEIFCRAMEDGLPKREAIKLARQAACYSDMTTNTHIFTPNLVQAILDDVNKRIALNAPAAVNALEEVLHNPERKGASNLLAAVASLLDRAGITKKEPQEVTVKGASAIIILPPKAPLGLEPTAS